MTTPTQQPSAPSAGPAEFNTTEAGRAEVARFFSQHLKRHDFTRYITTTLAADFACALAPTLHAIMDGAAPLMANGLTECAAKGSGGCSYGPHGPGGTQQCEWCGEPPQETAATASVAGLVGPRTLTEAQIERHAILAGDCPPNSQVILVSSIQRLLGYTSTPQAAPSAPTVQPLTDWQIEALQGLDTASRVRFYEHDFYVLSNFSAFRLEWEGEIFDTSEAAYHAEKFWGYGPVHANWDLIRTIREAPSAHEAFKIAERNKALRRPDWDAVKVGIMKRILRAKADQHEYVRRKLMATGNRELVEDSWRDDFWGWGPDRKGQNMLGRLWMEVRAELAGITAAPTKETP